MVTQELVKAVTEQWMREAARLQLEQQARTVGAGGASPRRVRSRLRIRRPSLPPFVGCLFRSAPTS